METKDLRSLPPIAQEYLRIKAIKAILDGKNQIEVAELFGVTRQAVGKWMRAYREGGEKALQAKSRGRPKGGYLLPWQVKDLEELLSQGATSHGWLNNMWTARRVAEMIQRHLEIIFSASHVQRILKKQLGWTCQKPVHQSGERDDIKIKKWKTQTFNSIRKASTKTNAYLVFIDESGFMLAPLRRRTYAPRGHAPVQKVVDPHSRISVISAITVSPLRNRTNLFFYLLPDNTNFTSISIMQFIRQLRHIIPKPINIIWDAIPIHSSNVVNNFISENSDIAAYKFPPYAPELNPIDSVWSYIKYSRLANYTPSDLTQLRYTVNEELMRLRKRTDLLHSFIRGTGLVLSS